MKTACRFCLVWLWTMTLAHGQDPRPNILMIMTDDVGVWNVGAYSHGMMAPTPNIDRLAQEGILFTDHYSQPTCTPGRAAFITGQLPIRTGLTTVGMADPRSVSTTVIQHWRKS